MKFPLAQYHWKSLSENFAVATLEYEGSADSMAIKGDGVWAQVPMKCGTCHGIAIWVDYGMRERIGESEEYNFSTMTSGNRFHQQAVRFLPHPVVINGQTTEGKCTPALVRVRPSFSPSCPLEDHDFEIKIEIS